MFRNGNVLQKRANLTRNQFLISNNKLSLKSVPEAAAWMSDGQGALGDAIYLRERLRES